MGLIVTLSEYYRNFFIHRPFLKYIDIILFENYQGINPMGLSASLTDFKNNTSQI